MELYIGKRFTFEDPSPPVCPACGHPIDRKSDAYGDIEQDDYTIECSSCGLVIKFAAAEFVVNSFEVDLLEAPVGASSAEVDRIEKFRAEHMPVAPVPDTPPVPAQLPTGHTPKVWKTCRNGHLCDMTAKFCPECGGPL